MRQSRHRSFFAVVLALGLLQVAQVGPVAGAPSGTDVDEGFLYEHPGTAGWQGVYFGDKGDDYMEAVSVLYGRPDDDWGFLVCTKNSDANCTGRKTVEFSAMLQPCATAASLDCVSGFGHLAADGTRVPATYVSKFPSDSLNDFAADPAAGLPAGTAAGVWQLGAGSGSTTGLHYLRSVVSGKRTTGSKFEFTQYRAVVAPVEMTPWSCRDAFCTLGYTPHDDGKTSGFQYGQGRDDGLDCVMTGTNPLTGAMTCAKRKAFTPTVRYYVTVRLSQSPKGWLHGRLNEPQISIAPIAGSDDALTIDIAGGSVAVPVISTGRQFKDLPAAMQDSYRKNGGWPVANGSGYFTSRDGPAGENWGPEQRNRLSIPPAGGTVGLAELEAWLPLVNDTATADLSQWIVRTLQEWELQGANKCLTAKQRLNGVVVTNATQYSAGPPDFDSTTGTLNYRVSAPHYRSGGSETKGVYELFVRSETARCLYGFDKAPIKSTIEVIENAGVQDIATTNVSERNGWLQLSAYNYTHSSPTLKVKLGQRVSGFAFVKKGRSLSSSALAAAAGMKPSTGAKVTVRVVSGGSKCSSTGSAVRARVKGSCRVVVTVRKGAKSSSRTVDVSTL
jgi:hypothetical protein